MYIIKTNVTDDLATQGAMISTAMGFNWSVRNNIPLSAIYLIPTHYSDVIMTAMMSHVTCVSIVCLTVCSDADQRKHQSSTSLAFVRGFPSQRTNNTENVSIWWRNHVSIMPTVYTSMWHGHWSILSQNFRTILLVLGLQSLCLGISVATLKKWCDSLHFRIPWGPLGFVSEWHILFKCTAFSKILDIKPVKYK